jgi:hypothetical protein
VVRKLSLTDFRAVRRCLEPDDFCIAPEGPEQPPADPIDEATWRALMALPEDVAIRTTNDRGSSVYLLHHLHSAWIEAMPEGPMVGYAMLDAADAFDASLFNLVHGYYKQALGALRDGLEVMAIACLCELTADAAAWAAWEGGDELRFNHLCDRLQNLAPLRPLEAQALAMAGTNAFAGDNGAGRGAWVRDLYRRLSRYAHARGGAMNGHIWQSNGPIYEPKGYEFASAAWLETHAICFLMAKIARADIRVLAPTGLALQPENIRLVVPPPFDRVCRAYAEQIIPDAAGGP